MSESSFLTSKRVVVPNCFSKSVLRSVSLRGAYKMPVHGTMSKSIKFELFFRLSPFLRLFSFLQTKVKYHWRNQYLILNTVDHCYTLKRYYLLNLNSFLSVLCTEWKVNLWVDRCVIVDKLGGR